MLVVSSPAAAVYQLALRVVAMYPSFFSKTAWCDQAFIFLIVAVLIPGHVNLSVVEIWDERFQQNNVYQDILKLSE